MGVRPRCAWTGRTGGELVEITVPRWTALGRPDGEQTLTVAPEHAERAEAFLRFASRNVRRFLALILAGCLALVASALLAWPVASGLACVGMGLVIVVLPFATPQTVQVFGLATAIVLARAGGLVLMALGAVIASGVLPG